MVNSAIAVWQNGRIVSLWSFAGWPLEWMENNDPSDFSQPVEADAQEPQSKQLQPKEPQSPKTQSPKTQSPKTQPKGLLKSYIQFLRSPVLTDEPEPLPNKTARNHILRLYTLHLLVVLAVGMVISQVLGEQDNQQLFELLADIPDWLLIFMAVIAMPTLEEVVFRLPLRAFAVNMVLAGSVVIWFGVSISVGGLSVSSQLTFPVKFDERDSSPQPSPVA